MGVHQGPQFSASLVASSGAMLLGERAAVAAGGGGGGGRGRGLPTILAKGIISKGFDSRFPRNKTLEDRAAVRARENQA